jgi:purine-cytosine permease-like protein
LVVSAAAFVASALLIFITVVYGCHGSDVSEPPPEGSTGDLLCPGAAWVSHLALGGVAVIVPWVAVSPWPRWLDLRVGFAISAAAILLLTLFGSAVETSVEGLLVPPALVVFAAAVVLAARPRREKGEKLTK